MGLRREPTGEPVVRRVCPLKPQVGGKGASISQGRKASQWTVTWNSRVNCVVIHVSGSLGSSLVR